MTAFILYALAETALLLPASTWLLGRPLDAFAFWPLALASGLLWRHAPERRRVAVLAALSTVLAVSLSAVSALSLPAWLILTWLAAWRGSDMIDHPSDPLRLERSLQVGLLIAIAAGFAHRGETGYSLLLGGAALLATRVATRLKDRERQTASLTLVYMATLLVGAILVGALLFPSTFISGLFRVGAAVNGALYALLPLFELAVAPFFWLLDTVLPALLLLMGIHPRTHPGGAARGAFRPLHAVSGLSLRPWLPEAAGIALFLALILGLLRMAGAPDRREGLDGNERSRSPLVPTGKAAGPQLKGWPYSLPEEEGVRGQIRRRFQRFLVDAASLGREVPSSASAREAAHGLLPDEARTPTFITLYEEARYGEGLPEATIVDEAWSWLAGELRRSTPTKKPHEPGGDPAGR